MRSECDYLFTSAAWAFSFCELVHVHACVRMAELVAVDHADDEAPESTWPPLHQLAKMWDAHEFVRAQLRASGKILSWPSPASTGVASKASLKLNRFPMQILLKVWAAHCETPKSPPIAWLRQEVGSVAHAACMESFSLSLRLKKSTGYSAQNLTVSRCMWMNGA